MAKIRCKCGTILRDDDPHDTFWLLSDEEFDVELSATLLFGRALRVVRCKVCQRLWFWGDDEMTEYLKADALPEDPAPSDG
ncbi:hypothetical protein [Amycolatopsis kentuckyensis]|uniref:hypothetical protein n=1 Tax=Amycolatopsis kentuckyensis TaxID=218823 RepID=UPI000A3B1664|nr:hypothetical protein [Amycolatopsis kentuckyensis]